MLLFIIIFFALVITVGLSAVLGFSFYLNRRTKRLETENPAYINPPEYRSLFALTEEEIRTSEREESERQTAKETQEARQDQDKKLAALDEFRVSWLQTPDKKQTAELFRRAAETASAQSYSETASQVIETWREGKIKGLSSRNLADLLDSHLRTLPQQERASGALFWLKKEIAELTAPEDRGRI